MPPFRRSSWFAVVFVIGLTAGIVVRATGLPQVASIAAVLAVVVVGVLIPVEKRSPDPPDQPPRSDRP